MSIDIIKKILVNNDCYKKGQTIKPTGIVVHSTACNQTDANVFIERWNKSGVEKSIHAFIDAKGIYQTLPFTMRCWGCGSGSKGSYNNSHLQFELCEDDLKGKEYFTNVYNKAVEFCAFLCKQYDIDVKNIVCHSEAYKLGYSSNHADVMHWFPKFNKSMDTFRADVKKALTPVTATPVVVKNTVVNKVVTVIKKVTTKKSKKAIIKELQSALNSSYKCNLKVDGIVGDLVKAQLKKVYLKDFAKNAYVKWVQENLKNLGYSIDVDGKYGEGSEKVVKVFQVKYKLEKDGYFGYSSAMKLISLIK